MDLLPGPALAAQAAGVVPADAPISELFALPVHPIWSIILIIFFVMALIGFVVTRGPLEADEEGRPEGSSMPYKSAIRDDEYTGPGQTF